MTQILDKKPNNLKVFLDKNVPPEGRDALMESMMAWEISKKTLGNDIYSFDIPLWRRRVWITELRRAGFEVMPKDIFPNYADNPAILAFV